MNAEESVLVEMRGHVALVILNRPEKMNAFDQPMMERMRAVFDSVGENPQCRVMVLTGAGGNFSSGGDVGGLGLGATLASQPTITLMQNMRRYQHRLQLALANVPVPTIAAVEGVAVSGGLDLALCCDMRVAAESARLGETYTRLGLVPGNGGCFLLAALLGPAKAAELIYTSRVLRAGEAAALGLLNEVTVDGKAVEAALALAERIAANAPLAVRFAKELLVSVQRRKLAEHLEQVGPLVSMLQQTGDHVEGAQAVRARRTPDFKGA